MLFNNSWHEKLRVQQKCGFNIWERHSCLLQIMMQMPCWRLHWRLFWWMWKILSSLYFKIIFHFAQCQPTPNVAYFPFNVISIQWKIPTFTLSFISMMSSFLTELSSVQRSAPSVDKIWSELSRNVKLHFTLVDGGPLRCSLMFLDRPSYVFQLFLLLSQSSVSIYK